MTEQRSYTKLEQRLRPVLRDKLAQAESTEDVVKFFHQVMCEFLDEVAEHPLNARYTEIGLDIHRGEGYFIAERIMVEGELPQEMAASDLNAVLDRLAVQAWHRYHHLAGNPAKTEKKITQRPTERIRNQ